MRKIVNNMHSIYLVESTTQDQIVFTNHAECFHRIENIIKSYNENTYWKYRYTWTYLHMLWLIHAPHMAHTPHGSIVQTMQHPHITHHPYSKYISYVTVHASSTCEQYLPRGVRVLMIRTSSWTLSGVTHSYPRLWPDRSRHDRLKAPGVQEQWWQVVTGEIR